MKFDKKLIFIVFELFVLVVGLKRAVRQPIELEYNNTVFSKLEGKNFCADSQGLHILGLDSGSVALGCEFTIHSGSAYEIFVDYLVDPQSALEDNCSFVLRLRDDEFNELHQSDVYLYPNSEESYGRVYSDGSGEAELILKYKKNEILNIQSVRIVERSIWQWIKLIVVAVIFILVDYIVYSGVVWKKLNKQRVYILALMILCAVPCILDFQFGGHDLLYHMQRIANVAKELSDGQIPVRLYSQVYNGYGYGAPLFYGDIFLYLPAILYNCMVPLYVCIQIYIFVISVVTALTAYYCFKYISNNNETIAFAGSFLYVFSPYRICCIWVRAAFGEYTALAFLPLILLGMYAIMVEEEFHFYNSFILGSGVALTTLCHILTVELALVPLILSTVLLYKRINRQRIKGILIAIGVFVGLTLWFLVPMFDSVFNLGIKAFNSTIEKEIQNSGLYLMQLLNPFYTYKGANIDKGMIDEMPLSLGIGAISGAVLPFFWLLERKKNGEKACQKVCVLWILGIIIAFMTTIYFPWNYVSRIASNGIAKWLNECQFTWRYMGLATVLLIAALCALLEEINLSNYVSYGNKLILPMICTISVIATSVFYSNYMNIQEEYRTYAYWNYSKGYLLTFFAIDADTDGIGEDEADIELVKGEANIDNSNLEEKTISLPVYAYLNVRVWDKTNGQYMDIDMNDNGLIRVLIPSNYMGTIKVCQVEPLLWRISEVISILCAIAFLIGAGKSSEKKRC